MRHHTTLACLAVVAAVAGCFPGPPVEPQPVEDSACGVAPELNTADDVVYAVSLDGCVRIERRAVGDGTFVPVRLIAHVNGLMKRVDVDTDAMTLETSSLGTETVTTDDVTVSTAVDPCTGEWSVSVNDGDVILPVVG